MKEKMLLEVQNLTKTFYIEGKPPAAAVNSVSFQLYSGEALGIVGESGCGKSTLARLLARLTDVTEGSVSFMGKDITKEKPNELRSVYRNMQMVFQSPKASFDPRRKLGESIGESLRNSGASKEDAMAHTKELMLQCGLPEEFADRYPHEVSGGQCQRAAIARALAIRPQMLICDEITSALDATVQKQIMELLESLKKSSGLSFLFITHNLALTQSFCDRLLVMHAGSVVEEGPPDEIIRAPKTEYARRLVEACLQGDGSI